MITRVCRGLFALAPSMLLGCGLAAHADEAADRAAIEAATQDWVAAFNARDADAMVALATEDVVLLNPDTAPVSGRKAAGVAWQQAASTAGARITVANKETAIAGDIAWKIGAVGCQPPDSATVNCGQFLEIWKRVGGQWKIHRRMSSGNFSAKPGMAPRPVPSEPILDQPGN